MNKKLIFGGTFNPIHIGHLVTAEVVREKYNFDKVYFMPTGNPPHKNKDILPAIERYEMVLDAIADNNNFDILDIETKSEQYSYTIQTIPMLKLLFPEEELYMLVGADSLMDIHTWNGYEKILKSINLIVTTRQDERLYATVKQYNDEFGINIQIAPEIEMNISSSKIRERIKNGQSIKYFVTSEVEKRIIENEYYKTLDYKQMFDVISVELKNILSEKRFAHTMSVVKTAEELASIHNVDIEKVRLAGLLHDYAKEYDDKKMMSMIKKYNIDIDKRAKDNINLMHAEVGAFIAMDKYNIYDMDIINTISKHTFGSCYMSDIEIIIGIADFCEPSRNFKGEMKEASINIYEIAKKDLKLAYITKLKNLIKDLDKLGEIDEVTIHTYEQLIENYNMEKNNG